MFYDSNTPGHGDYNKVLFWKARVGPYVGEGHEELGFL